MDAGDSVQAARLDENRQVYLRFSVKSSGREAAECDGGTELGDLVWCVMRGPVGACESRRCKARLETEGGERLRLPHK